MNKPIPEIQSDVLNIGDAAKVCADAINSFCEEGRECGTYSEERINKAGRHFMCPKCGRIDLRMEWATPENCGMVDK